MKKLVTAALVFAAIGAGAFWILTAPKTVDPSVVAGLTGDPARGEMVFFAGGCASCHSAQDASGDEKLHLGGGRRFASPFGTFVAPNISPDPDLGIGAWSALDLVNAMKQGVSPDGQHYFPAFPYASYTHAAVSDIVDLKAFLDTLPAVSTPSQGHDVGFPFNIRRMLGGWKLLFLNDSWVVDGAGFTDEQIRGRYLVEALGHCGECHTPRNSLGGLQTTSWLAGAPHPSGKGRFPNITPHDLDWSAGDIGIYLTTGFTPEFDTAGGEMADVIENMSHLPDEDIAAIVAYLKAVSPRP